MIAEKVIESFDTVLEEKQFFSEFAQVIIPHSRTSLFMYKELRR